MSTSSIGRRLGSSIGRRLWTACAGIVCVAALVAWSPGHDYRALAAGRLDRASAAAMSHRVGTSHRTGASALTTGWVITTHQFVNQFTAEPYVANGYFSQRIPAAGMGFLGTGLDEIGWPLVYPRTTEALAAGLYAYTKASNFYPTERKQVIAVIPTWSTLDFATPTGTYSPATVSAGSVGDYTQSLDLRTGTVTTSGVWSSPGGKRVRFTYQVFTDRARDHVGVVRLALTPMFTGRLKVTDMIDGAGARRLTGTGRGVQTATHTIHVDARTVGTGIPVSEAATLRYPVGLQVVDHAASVSAPMSAAEQIAFTGRAGHTYRITKYVAVVTGRDSSNPAGQAPAAAQAAAGIGADRLAAENQAAWAAGVWDSQVLVPGDPTLQTVIRANEYQLFASIRPGAPDALGPSGLSSDGYAGMVFWDSDIWMFPAMLAGHPDLARVVVDYRFHTLKAAEHDATVNGYRGAFYPWTAGDDGRTGHDCYGTVTTSNDRITSDPNNSCSEELHLQGDIALSQWEYYEATGDRTWLATHGWPVLKALANFWVSKATPGPAGAYSLDNLQPPDEAHIHVNNETYTEAVAITALRNATNAAHRVGKPVSASWARVAAGLATTMPFNSAQNIYEEFDGYDGSQIKQADVVMLTYPLNFPIPGTVGLNDLNYYAPLTNPQGPAMTDAIQSIDASALNAAGCSAYTYMLRSYEPFMRDPFDQFAETRNNSEIAFNFLTGIGGFLQVFQYGYSGLRYSPGYVSLDPSLSPQLPGIRLTNLQWHGRHFTVSIGPSTTTVTNLGGGALPLRTPSGQQTVAPGRTVTMPTRRPDQQPTSDLARCQAVTASSSVPGDDPVAAVDGSPATAWIAAQPSATLSVTLAHPATVSSVTVTRGLGFGSFSYQVQVSTDGSNWTTVATAPANSTGTDQFSFQPVTAAYVRLVFPGGAGAAAPDIGELSVSGP
jgi:trehalose/maltose hydrolase-like predicted phosphorylase